MPFFFEPHGRADCNLSLDEYADMYKKGQEPMSKEPLFYSNWLVGLLTNSKRVEFNILDYGPEMV